MSRMLASTEKCKRIFIRVIRYPDGGRGEGGLQVGSPAISYTSAVTVVHVTRVIYLVVEPGSLGATPASSKAIALFCFPILTHSVRDGIFSISNFSDCSKRKKI